jgi:alkylation response protein AidB-like acyl-CoA dehydrogenase
MAIEADPREKRATAGKPKAGYQAESVDALPFNTPEKTDRYDTERFYGATGLNWYLCDPTLQRAMRYYLTPAEIEWAEPHLVSLGALMGGPVSERAELTDKNPPKLIKYDRWGHEVSEVWLPESAVQTKKDLAEHAFYSADFRREAQERAVRTGPLTMASGYLLDQAEVGMTCAMGADAGMVHAMVERFAPPDVREFLLPKLESGEMIGLTGQFFTERTGGSDLGELETTATRDGDAWKLNGFKWFCSNVNGEAFVVLAKPEGGRDDVKGVTAFLVLKTRRDGTRNGFRIRQLKDKLGTKAVPSGEVEFVDAEAFMLAPPPREGEGDGGPSDGRTMARLMMMTNVARLGTAMMGLGCARRSLVESLCYARARSAWKKRLIDQPLMKRKLAEMIVDVEAVQALIFEGYGHPNRLRERADEERLRMAGALAKLKGARLGITMASDAIEVHGGNGYIETWPVARILRDAQVNTLWEGPDNILCLDIRRSMERENADGPFLERLREAVSNAGESVQAARIVSARIDDLEAAIEAWKQLDRETAEARLFPLAQFMAEVYAGALLSEQAEWELSEFGDDRKSIVALLYVQRYLGDPDRLRGVGAPSNLAIERFDDLVAGALVDDRPR